jgi:ribosomal protein L32
MLSRIILEFKCFLYNLDKCKNCCHAKIRHRLGEDGIIYCCARVGFDYCECVNNEKKI